MDKQRFINLIKDGAIQAQRKYGICASMTIAQAALESGWGAKIPGNNLFGIKWTPGCGYERQLLNTTERIHDKDILIKDYFRKYKSFAESIDDHTQFLVRNSNYHNLLGVTDYKVACKLIKDDKYATGAGYTEILIKIIEENKLYLYDVPQSFIKIDGGGYANWNGAPGVNLIIRDFSPDISRIFAWTDSDKGASWSFALQVPNSNYTQLKRGINKVVTRRNGGYSFSKNSTYKISVKGYNEAGKVVATASIIIRIPQK